MNDESDDSMILGIILLLFPNSAFANNDLVGSTFVCGANTCTFFPDNKYTYNLHIASLRKQIKTISYSYDGTNLELHYIGVNGNNRVLRYKATYLPNKGKLILADGERQEICAEH